MLTYQNDLNRFEAVNVADLKETPLTCGSVFHVHAYALRKDAKSRTMLIQLYLIANEGRGNEYFMLLANNQRESIPTQVELMLMDIGCEPTWGWSYGNGRYHGEFAISRNHKVVDDSGAAAFPVVM